MTDTKILCFSENFMGYVGLIDNKVIDVAQPGRENQSQIM